MISFTPNFLLPPPISLLSLCLPSSLIPFSFIHMYSLPSCTSLFSFFFLSSLHFSLPLSPPLLPSISPFPLSSLFPSPAAMYKFSEVNFRLFSDIPRSLLKGIAHCFKDKKLVCRKCFYGDRSISHLQLNNKCSTGEHHWTNPVVVIPGQLTVMWPAH